MNRYYTIRWSLIIFLLGIQALAIAWLAFTTSANRTEIIHIGSAMYYHHTGKFDVGRHNTPLVRMIAAIPLNFIDVNYDDSVYSNVPLARNEFNLGVATIAANMVNKGTKMFPKTGHMEYFHWLFWGRMACVPIILLGGFYGYLWAKELYGLAAGFGFLVLWTVSPLVLGWGATINPDIHAAAMGIVGLYHFRKWLYYRTWTHTILTGVLLGLMILTKPTWVIAVPMFCLLYIAWVLIAQTKWNHVQFICILLQGLLVLNAGYGFDGSGKLLKGYTFVCNALTGHSGTEHSQGNRFAESALGYIPVPFPAEFIQGIDIQKFDFERGLLSYADGEWSERGKWWHYLYTLCLKEPLGVLIMAMITVILIAARYFRIGKDEFLLLFMGIGIFIFVSANTGLSGNPRYYAPALPFLYLFVSRLAQRKMSGAIFAGLLLWVIISSAINMPYAMAYMNEAAGFQKDRAKCLLQSNLDWGQNEYNVANFINNSWENTALSKKVGVRPYNGMCDYTEKNGVVYVRPNVFVSDQLVDPLLFNYIYQINTVKNIKEKTYVFVSVNELFSPSNNDKKWLLEYSPVTTICGGTVYVYYME